MSQPRRKPKLLSSEVVPDDVVFDILTQMPVKSLIRFRCVSKSLNSIITNPNFIKKHFNRPNANNNGYLLYLRRSEDYYSLRNELCTVVCNSDKTLSHVSRFQIPFSHVRIVDFCNGIFCMYNYNNNNIVYLWNPSTRKFKMLDYTRFCFSFTSGFVSLGFAYHSQNNDFKILRIVSFKRILGEQLRRTVLAEVYTLSTDSWRKVVISKIEFIAEPTHLFFNGALHSIASSQDYKFILSFDLNDERFREIMLPPNYLDGARQHSQSLAVFKGSLALIVLGENLVGDRDICDIWVMREYGVVESWTKESVLVDGFEKFFCCTDSGELLIHTFQRGFVSYDPENLNWNKLLILRPPWLSYTADLMESLVLLDQVKCN